MGNRTKSGDGEWGFTEKSFSKSLVPGAEALHLGELTT